MKINYKGERCNMKDFEYSTTRNGNFIKVPRMQNCIDAILITYEAA